MSCAKCICALSSRSLRKLESTATNENFWKYQIFNVKKRKYNMTSTNVSCCDERAEDFRDRLVQTLEQSFLSVSLHIGNKLGLFDVLAEWTSPDSPKTSQQVADIVKLKERYVREWLCSMVAGGVVESDESGTKFWLPQHRYRSLNSKGPTPLNFLHHLMGHATQNIDSILDCFKLDGPNGLPYSAYENFHKQMDAASRSDYETNLIPNFVPSIPGLQQELESGIQFLDVGCGAGVAVRLLAARFPNSQFYGIDFSEECVHLANSELGTLKNLHYEVLDAVDLRKEWSNYFDFVATFDSIHDQAYPDKSLKEIFRVLKPGGRYSMTDVEGTSNPYEDREKNIPFRNFKYTASITHCVPVSMYFEGGMGLGTMWGEKKAKEMLAEAGFVEIQVLDIPFSMVNVNYLSKKPDSAKAN